MPNLFSYVVEHDRGHAPNPYFNDCTLCRCKYRESKSKPRNLIERAEIGDWVVGTGGANRKRSSGHGTIVYAMRVDEKLTRQKYFHQRRFHKKKPVGTGSYDRTLGDNLEPQSPFEQEQQFVLISRHFFYFGKKAISYPTKKFPHLEKRGPRYRRDFDDEFIERFVKWLTSETGYKPGKHGDPCMREVESPSRKSRNKDCKPSC